MKKYLAVLIKGTRTTDLKFDSDDVEGAAHRAKVHADAKGAKVLAIYELHKVA